MFGFEKGPYPFFPGVRRKRGTAPFGPYFVPFVPLVAFVTFALAV